MATKSILKTVSIRDRRSARALVTALENARGRKKKDTRPNSTCHEMSKEEIRQAFGTGK